MHKTIAGSAALIFAGAITVFGGGSASAQSVPDASSPAALTCPYESPVVPARGSIQVLGPTALGVVHLADGDCAHGAYDVILSDRQDTYHTLGWNEAAFAFIGSGFYAYADRIDNPGFSEYCVGPCWLSAMDGRDWTVEAWPN